MGDRRTALITGASSGFGAEFARLFARDGFDLVLVARSGAAMEELAQVLDGRFGSTTTVLPKDLSHPHAVGELVDNLHQRGVAIDALVNNAGFAQYGPFAEAEPEELVEMLHVNVVALTELTRALLPGMVERGWGRIVNLGSVGSFAPAPMTGAYAATKAFVLFVLAGARRGAEGVGRHRDRAVPRPDRDRVPGAGRDGRLPADRRTAAGSGG